MLDLDVLLREGRVWMEGVAVAGEGADFEPAPLDLRLVVLDGLLRGEEVLEGAVLCAGIVAGADLDRFQPVFGDVVEGVAEGHVAEEHSEDAEFHVNLLKSLLPNPLLRESLPHL